jgi:hypothetical protein
MALIQIPKSMVHSMIGNLVIDDIYELRPQSHYRRVV